MKVLSRNVLMAAITMMAMSVMAVDGVYPHLAMSNDEGECGTGAVVPWAGSLWAITYGPHCPTGSTDKLYQITPDLRQIVRAESVGGTPANRLIHRETNQLLIGPYVIDAKGNVRVVPPASMPGRLTGAARHLTDPDKVYVATMETGLYELDMRTLSVNTLIRENGKNDHEIAMCVAKAGGVWPSGWNKAPVTHVPGYHGKGLCSGFGRVFVANNGEDSEAARRDPFVPSGVLADWSTPGKDWRTVRRCQFTEITTADGILGNEHPGSNPVWALGWDAKSVLLAVTTNGCAWSYYRLPKASHCYDGAHGWNTEWPRIREAGLGGDALLATMHGTFWRFPRGFSPAQPNGIRPISTYLKVVGDFCYWQDAPGEGSIVFGCDDHAKCEFLGKRKLKSDQPKIDRSTSNLWFVKPEDLKTFGPPTGEGWVWRGEDVKAGEVSDSYLWEGYVTREFNFIDASGNPVRHELLHEGDWVRVRALEDAKGASAHFIYGLTRPDVLPTLDAKVPYVKLTDDNGVVYRFPNVNGDTNVICREVATERDLLYVGGVFYEVPAENAGGFRELRPIALSDEPVRSIAVDRGLVVINGKSRVLDSLWRNGTAAAAYWLWRETVQTEDIMLECERFDTLGGWTIDSQFMGEMGSSYLLAHGLGKPVADAATTFAVKTTGTYNVFVRTKNWTAKWSNARGAGRFQIAINGETMSECLGVQGTGEWLWVKAGSVALVTGPNTIVLHDLTGFDGRVDAVCLTTAQDIQASRVSQKSQFSKTLSSDLVVAGGGIAGICTAISAARLGLKVALVQDRPVLGGANSSEVRVHLGGRINLGDYPRLGDVVAEIGPANVGNACPAENYEDDRKLAAVLSEKNISLHLNTRVVSVEPCAANEKRIKAVVGRDVLTGIQTRFEAPLFADCTGDGTVGYLAGADYRIGREGRMETGEDCAPEVADRMTMGASCQWYAERKAKRNYDGGAIGRINFPNEPWMIRLDEKAVDYALRGDWDWETGMNSDQLNDFETVRDYAMLVAYSNWNHVKNISVRKAEYADAELAWVAYVAGKRETRRLMGDHVLCQQDIFENRPYPDGTCWATWSVDLHYPMPANMRNFSGEPFRSICRHSVHNGYPIPYRCFYSHNVLNLFMAGRDISVTHVALGTTRVMRTHGMQGEVVGMAASLCKKHGCGPRGVYLNHLDELKSLMTKGVGLGKPQPPQNYNLGTMNLKEK